MIRPRLVAVAAVIAFGGLGACADGSGDAKPADSSADVVVLGSADAGGVADGGIPVNHDSAGAPFPDVPIRDAADRVIRTASLLGKPLVVNVWYSACAPCKKELPAFATVAKAYTGRVDFVGVNTVDDDAGAAFAGKLGVTYPLYKDLDGELTTALQLGNFPVTVFVRANGTIARQTGPIDEATLRATIDAQLLAG